MHFGTPYKKYVFWCMRINLGCQECESKENVLACMWKQKKIRLLMLYFVHKYMISPAARLVRTSL
jgi:hypothetical protein